MTIASANINLQLALPQGRTAEEVLELLSNLLSELQDEQGSPVVDFEISDVHVNADPFAREFAKRVLPNSIGLLGNGIGQGSKLLPFITGQHQQVKR